MKFPALASFVVISTLTSAFAITDADIAPAALAGKTLKFTIVNGGSPFATTGTWSGAFAAFGNGFNVAKITGDTVPVSTTFSATADGGFTNVSLVKFVEGKKPATLTLYTVNGVGNYEVSIQDVFGVSLNGTFKIGATAIKKPEINVLINPGDELTDGTTINLGTDALGNAAVNAQFIIKNTGTANLTGLRIVKSGANKSDFIVEKLKKTTLAPGQSVRFSLYFNPTPLVTKRATIHILSNDADENPFDIKLTGILPVF